tara:strand:+ start:3878 stop:4654 length:777 start_codon:yes stop_codon:yes gene_type:complete
MINIREALQDSIFELLRPYRSSQGSLFNKGQYIELSYHSKDPHQKRIVRGGSRPFSYTYANFTDFNIYFYYDKKTDILKVCGESADVSNIEDILTRRFSGFKWEVKMKEDYSLYFIDNSIKEVKSELQLLYFLGFVYGGSSSGYDGTYSIYQFVDEIHLRRSSSDFNQTRLYNGDDLIGVVYYLSELIELLSDNNWLYYEKLHPKKLISDCCAKSWFSDCYGYKVSKQMTTEEFHDDIESYRKNFIKRYPFSETKFKK